jgi:trehalose 6-phosphate synthase
VTVEQEGEMSGLGARLFVVSNRVAFRETRQAQAAGGMAVAVKAALKNRNAAWFGWSGEVADVTRAETRTVRVKKVDYVFFDLSTVDIREYYSGFAKNVLWPVLHYRVDLQKYSHLDASGYLRVNHLFADRLSPLLDDDDVVWVHDYHLMPLARELRSRGRHNAIGFFLHAPCAPPEFLQAMPSHDEILGSLTHYDLVGFQTENDRDNFEHYLVSRDAKPMRDGALEMGGRRMRLGVFPVGIETAAFRRLSGVADHSALVHEVRSSLGESRLVLGVDRIDCSKGILHRMKAFERFLEISPVWLGKATLLQVTPARSPDDKRFSEIEAELAGLIARINGRFGDAAWTPIRYVNRPYSRGVLAGICRLADAALVTPLRDGMNLVAKEFVAAQDTQDPGVLVLSQFAGAANELDRALIVNPYETDAVAFALERALEMPLPERRERHATMLRRLMDWDIETWAENYVSALVECRSRRGVLGGIRLLFDKLSEQRAFAPQRPFATQGALATR